MAQEGVKEGWVGFGGLEGGGVKVDIPMRSRGGRKEKAWPMAS